MTTEYRPLLTAAGFRELTSVAAVEAALAAGERVEYTAFPASEDPVSMPSSDEPGSGGWVRHFDDEKITFRGSGSRIRYRARPAGEEVEESPDTQAEIAAREQIAAQAAEIEALRAEVARLVLIDKCYRKMAVRNVELIDRATAAEARAARLEEALREARQVRAERDRLIAFLCDDSIAVTFQTLGQYRTAALAALGPGGGA